jgi:hypothetical protein
VAAKVISGNPFSFVKGRNIVHCIATASEGINVLDNKSFGGNMALKVDIRKAFDTMDWGFILEIFEAFGFSFKFRDWILAIFSSARLSILLNGSAKGYFSCKRGVRQASLTSSLCYC